MCPADHESLVHVESRVEHMIANMPADKAYTLTFFRSKGTGKVFLIEVLMFLSHSKRDNAFGSLYF